MLRPPSCRTRHPAGLAGFSARERSRGGRLETHAQGGRGHAVFHQLGTNRGARRRGFAAAGIANLVSAFCRENSTRRGCGSTVPAKFSASSGTNVVGWNVLPGPVPRAHPRGPAEPAVRGRRRAAGAEPVGARGLSRPSAAAAPHAGRRGAALGFVRVANNGAVRLEVTDTTGMMQLAPAQFPGAAIESGARQIFVYRFPSATYGYRIVANQIQSEVSVSEITTYELTETDRVIDADLELDVREAPLARLVAADSRRTTQSWRSPAATWPITRRIRSDERLSHAQDSVWPRGRGTAAAAPAPREKPAGRRGRMAAAGAAVSRCEIRARTSRRRVGARLSHGPCDHRKLVEVPLSFFPRQITGLQQAWRLREPQWTAAVRLEALGQSVQADVFHLYSLKEGVVYGSVLFNYFVVGAPASEWRIEVPESVGNIDVVGQNVRRDWRREGNQVIVALHQPVLGAATLLITFEQPMSARGGTIHPGRAAAARRAERTRVSAGRESSAGEAHHQSHRRRAVETRTTRVASGIPSAHDFALARGLSIHRAAVHFRDGYRVVSAGGNDRSGGRLCEVVEPGLARRTSRDRRAVLREDRAVAKRCGWSCRKA